MDGSSLVGLASVVSLTDAGVVLGLILLGWALHKHATKDAEDRRRIYQKMDEIKDTLHRDHQQLDAKIDRLAEAVARLEGFHEAERDNK